MKKITKIMGSVLITIISLIFYVYFIITCKTGIDCSKILPGQIPFIIIGILALIYLIYTLSSKK